MGRKLFGKTTKMIKIKKCEICGKRNFQFLFNLKDNSLGIPGKFNFVKCKDCELIFMNPQPSLNELQKHYPKETYYSLGKINLKESSLKTRMKILLYKIYFSPRNKNYFLKTIFSPLKFFVRGTRINHNDKLLDIGSGSGQFLYEMKQLGIKGYGVEPGNFEKGIAKKEGLKIKNLDLIQSKYPRDFFDLITMNHVLEHVNNPSKTIKEIHRILYKKGLLIMGVPNSNSLAYGLFKKNWYQLDVPRHLFNYSDKNLKDLLKKEGFKVINVRYNSRPSQFSVSLSYFLKGKKWNNRLIDFIFTVLFLPLTWMVNFLRWGDQIEVYCVKEKGL